MADRSGIFTGDNPFEIAQRWLGDAEAAEPSYANAAALSTIDADGMPNVRIILIKDIEDDGFVFFTNYLSQKGQEIAVAGKAAINLYWKSLGRQVRVRGQIEKVSASVSDEYYQTRPLGSRVGAWASKQSEPLASRQDLISAVDSAAQSLGEQPDRPPHWGGYKIIPSEIEFWADGEFRLHDRFRWSRASETSEWQIDRLNP